MNTTSVLRSLAMAFALCAFSPLAGAFSDDTATYTVRFDTLWSATTHPVNFPAGAHFSGLVGASHDSSIKFWEPGGLASTGIESMAETGSKTSLALEVSSAVGSGQALQLISGGAVFNLPGFANASFSVSLQHPEVTVVTMIAPSPDWFLGVSGLSMFENGDWVDSKVVNLFSYDAGTDSGVDFPSLNLDTNPADPIAPILGFPFNGTGPMGTFTFTRTDDPTNLWTDLGLALAGTNGLPALVADGSLCAGTTLDMTLDDALENSTAWLAVGFDRIDVPFFGGVFVPDIVSPSGFLIPFGTGASGNLQLSALWPAGLPGDIDIYAQFWVMDGGAPFGFSGSNAVMATTP